MRNGLVEGVSLRAVLRESEAMAPEAAASVLAGMLVTLAVVHGDVRPEHIRVDGSGGIALTDFGGTEARFVPNSPCYLPPERLGGATASEVGDVFSATAVFFECLTDESPFVAATRDDLLALHEYAEIIAEFAPQELRALVQRGMTPDPGRRPATPHEFLDEVTSTASAVYGSDWQQRGRALLSGWAAAAARAAGTELAGTAGPTEAPPVGEPIDEALLGLEGGDELEDLAPAESAESAAVATAVMAGAEAGDEAEMPPPMGEPIDEELLDAQEESADQAVAAEEVAVEVPAEAPAATQAVGDKEYDWFTGGGKAEPVGAEADVLAAFDGARAGRASEPEPAPYTPTGFDVFAGRSGGSAPTVEDEPVSGHWDEPETDGAGQKDKDDAESELTPDAGSLSAETAESEAEASSGAWAEAFVEQGPEAEETAAEAGDDVLAEATDPLESAAEPEAAIEADAVADEDDEDDEATDSEFEFEPLIEDSSELLAAFDAFAPTAADEPEAEPEPEPEVVVAPEASPEPLPKRDPFAGLRLETLAAGSLLSESASPEATAAAEAEDLASDEAPSAEAEAEPEAEATTSSDFEDDWVIPAKPSPRVPRSLSAFAVSLPSLPRPDAEAEEPKPPVQTSAPDDWFRPGVAEPVGVDAHHTQVLNPDRDNTLESEATRTFDEVPAELAEAAGKGKAAASDEAVRDDADDRPEFDDRSGARGGPNGPRRKTVVGAVTTAVLLVAGAAAVVLGGSGKAPQGTGGTPTETSSSSAPAATAAPTTPTGTNNGSDSTSTSSTPSSHHSATHSRSHTSSPSTSTHSSSETPTHSSSSGTPTDQTSSSNPSSSASSPSSSCSTGILGLPECGGGTSGGPPTGTPSTGH